MRLLVPLLAALAVPPALVGEAPARLDHGAEFLGMEIDEEVAPGGTLALDLWFRMPTAPEPGVQVFLHLESNASKCRIVQDRPPTSWEDGIVHHHVDVPVADIADCGPQRLEVFTGVWNRRTGERWRVLEPVTLDDRIHAGSTEIVAGSPSGARATFSAADMQTRRFLGKLAAWRGWLLGLLAAAVLALLLRRVLRERAPPPVEPPRRARLAATLGVLTLLTLSILVALDFIKDDAYISFRYTHNLVVGDGLVFNKGEYLEGYTNFLWTLLMAPFEALGMDLFQVTEVLGWALCVALLLVMIRAARLLAGTAEGLSDHWAAAWVAASSSLALWSTSGMEQPLAMLLPIAGATLLWRHQDDAEGAARPAAWAGALLGLGCLTRPEIHLIGALVGLPLLARAVRRRRLDPVMLAYAAGVLAVTVPAHAFRWLYYGSLVPNTFYVKTGASSLIIERGLQSLQDMLRFNGTGALALLAPLAFLDRRHTAEKLVAAAAAAGFMAYIVKVGVDEMRWHRLFLPALPFLALLAGNGLYNLTRVAAGLVSGRAAAGGSGRARRVALAAGWLLVLAAVATSARFTWREKAGFNGRADLDGNYHPDIGKFITRHERPHALVAFQDMGSTPYHAPDIDFLDFIGLVDGTVARARHSYGLHPFTATEAHHSQRDFDRDMRAYFYERNPEWVIMTSYVGGSAIPRVSEAFARDPGPKALEPFIGTNGYQFGLWGDEFRSRYAHVRTWPKSAGYYLSLFRRRDLWEQTPGEVILDVLPAGVGGVKASFDRGLELLGSEVQREAVQKHELFVTTWWRLPGPLEDDVTFFIHVEKEGWRRPYDQVPGDWMYPAPRWQAGQLMENRTLVQLPWNMPPGDYKVFMGAYRRSTGQRLDVTSGNDDGGDRVYLGDVHIRPQRPFLDHLIAPTDPDEQRRYPERILDSGRPR